MNVGHLRQLARMGGVIPFGEVAFCKTMCEICHKGDDEENIVLCDKCNKGFHLYCVKPILPSVPSGEWFCDNCREKDRKKYISNRKKLEESQSLIVDFFKLDKPIPIVTKYYFRKSTVASTTPMMTAMPSKPPKGRGYLCCYKPSTDPIKIKSQHVALASAMFQQNIQYSYELVYRSGCATKMNNVKFDEERHLLKVGLEERAQKKEICKSDREVYEQTIKMSKEGFMAPVIVQQDDIQG